MSKTQKNDLELAPDAWARFERAIDVVAKSPPQHRSGKSRKIMTRKGKSAQSKKRRKTKTV